MQANLMSWSGTVRQAELRYLHFHTIVIISNWKICSAKALTVVNARIKETETVQNLKFCTFYSNGKPFLT